jgi:hypothetical protein
MKRRSFLIGTMALAVTGAPVFAQSVVDGIVAQLTSQGYRNISVQKTLLGRAQIVGYKRSQRREIIVNPRTGEILRDFWEDGVGAPQIVDADEVDGGQGRGQGKGRGRGRGGDNGSGDDEGDDGDDHGGGNSGNGGSGGNSGGGGGNSGGGNSGGGNGGGGNGGGGGDDDGDDD